MRKYPPIGIGRDRDQLMADSVHIRSFCAQASRQGCFGRLRAADVNAATIRRAYVCVSRLAAGWSLTLAVLAAQIRRSSDLIDGDSPTWAGSRETTRTYSAKPRR